MRIAMMGMRARVRGRVRGNDGATFVCVFTQGPG